MWAHVHTYTWWWHLLSFPMPLGHICLHATQADDHRSNGEIVAIQLYVFYMLGFCGEDKTARIRIHIYKYYEMAKIKAYTLTCTHNNTHTCIHTCTRNNTQTCHIYTHTDTSHLYAQCYTYMYLPYSHHRVTNTRTTHTHTHNWCTVSHFSSIPLTIADIEAGWHVATCTAAAAGGILK